MNLPIDVSTPLAERVRPQQLDDIWGQDHLVGENGAIHKLLEQGRIVSAILWGRPGTGKTTLARLISKRINHTCVELSAAVVGVSDIRKVIAQAAEERVLLFLDEIHRFNKNQQDILLPAVESGRIVLIGATTENPSFEVNKALLSRLQVFEIKSLDEQSMLAILTRALEVDELLKTKTVTLKSTKQLMNYANGDARKMLGIIDMIAKTSMTNTIVVDDILVSGLLQQKILQYDKTGDDHYDTISAFIKSIRGSDPNAALYWFARMLVAGEDILFIARRLVILASEDIGLANPNALVLANATFDSVHKIGMPEARIILSNCIIYLACSEKSNAAYIAVDKAMRLANQNAQHAVPLHLRNAPTKLMKDMGFGKNYQYDHNYQDHFSQQEFFPEEMAGTQLYVPQQNTREDQFKKLLDKRWGDKYKSE